MVSKQVEDTENPSIEIAAKTRAKKQPANAQTKETKLNVKPRRTSRKGSGGKTGETKRTVRNGSSTRAPVERTLAKQPFRKLNALERATAYADAVLAGDIIAGPHVRNACRRFHDDLAHGRERGIYFNVEKAQRVFDFFEQMLRLSDGQFEGKPLILAPVQAFMVGNLFGFMQVPKDADGNFVWEPGRRAALGLLERRRFRRAYIEMGKGQGKALALTTPIATPSGWSTMGDLRVGDSVFDELGKPNRVIGMSEIMRNHDCFEVEFSDGEKIVADADHLWITDARRPGGSKGKFNRGVRTTREIAATLRYKNGAYMTANHSINVAGGLDLPTAALPIEPYTLGYWLGDGDSDCARLTCHDDDAGEMHSNINADGYDVGVAQYKPDNAAARYRIGSVGIRGEGGFDSLNAKLRINGLFDRKHIPREYFRASFDQRLNLLRGLMDSDGHIAPMTGICELTSVIESLANEVLELVISLGIKATICEGDATIDGRVICKKYRVQFTPPDDVVVFKLKRKAVNQYIRHNRRALSRMRYIINVRKVDSVPVKCIKVEANSSLFLAGRNLVPTHNSPLAGGIGLYGLMGDGEGGSQIYAAASKKDQANILFHDACKMVRAAPSLFKRIKFSGSPGKEHNIAYLRKGAFFRPISKEAGKSGSGPRPLFALCDEVHEHPDRSIMEMLERGFKFRTSPLLLMITNSGTDKQSICWEEHEWSAKVAAGTRTPDEDFTYVGEPIDDTTFSYVCALDIGDDPLTDSSCWVKANPMLNIILSEQYLAGVVKQAVDMPGKRNGILRLHFCVWTDSVDAWMGKEIVDRAMEHFDPYEIHKEKEVATSIDLSASRDLTAAAFVVETGEVEVERQLQDGSVEIKTLPTYDAWIEAWTPKDTMVKRESEDHQPYLFWSQTNHVGSENQPYLRALPGERIRHDYLAGFFQDVDSKFKILGIAYDRYQYDKFREECDDRGLDLRHVAHPQGGKFRAKPDPIEVEAAKANKEEPPLGLWMPGSIKALEDAFTDGRIRLRFSPVLMSALMGATLSPPDDHGNKWFIKSKATVRIDPAVALAMAFGLMQDKPRKKKPKQFQLMVF